MQIAEVFRKDQFNVLSSDALSQSGIRCESQSTISHSLTQTHIIIIIIKGISVLSERTFSEHVSVAPSRKFENK